MCGRRDWERYYWVNGVLNFSSGDTRLGVLHLTNTFRNQADAMVCSYCFCYVGSLELQLAQRLLHQEGDSVGGMTPTQTASKTL
jgi:hypothetical protein